MVTGTVLERDGAHYRVLTPDGERRAVLRKKVKQEEFRVVVGDVVQLEPEAGGELYGIISIAPRRSVLERRVPEGRGTRLVVSNLDEVFVVAATRDPEPVLQLLDRLLVLAEANEILAAVVVNKTDLAPAAPLAGRFAGAGYRVIETSVRTGLGVDEFRGALRHHTAVVTGPSGVGKSSLLNQVEPGLGLRTGEISARVGRGRNTTVGAVMIPLSQGGYLVDTPGFSEVGLWGIDPRELASCFPEMRPWIGECRFQDCRHRTEPGCAIRQAVERGEIVADRLESYHVLLAELERAPREWE
ncbi:MAG TPA: ribosome small subunit-dependent GTPase A [Gemmatimonadales bacterium]|jgi:ribosome biogenesis GTPase|nr:ribosome small subunit-dependent GTPase A [Gemmatimonadales bacterium]